MRPAGFEPATPGLGNRCSILLSHERERAESSSTRRVWSRKKPGSLDLLPQSRNPWCVAILIGIDEAGYGPTLGPLVVAGAVFRVPNEAIKDCLWKRMAGSICARPANSDHRLPIADSKKLFQRSAGLGRLERTALVMASVAGVPVETARRFLEFVAPGCYRSFEESPWYEGFDRALPVDNDAHELALRGNAVKRNMAEQGVSYIGPICEILTARAFNRLVTNTRNKAVVSLGLVLRLVDRVAGDAGKEPVVALIDRQGGRTHYDGALRTAFTGSTLSIIREDEEGSAYELHDLVTPMRFEFTVSGEEAHLPIALASVTAKYVRELLMSTFNAYWCARVPGLKPTAGYYTDAMRFLADLKPIIESEPDLRNMLVRQR